MAHRPAGTLVASHIVKHRGGRPVLRDVSLTVTPGSRIGVVGPNGIGKSTLLQVLAGGIEPDGGTVARVPADLHVGYLPQEDDPRGDESVRDALARRTGVADAERELDRLTAAVGSDPSLAGAYDDALQRFLALGGADLDARASAACEAVGLGASMLASPVRELSGGERARTSLAVLTLARFDVFLLDEPTNNLDFEGLEIIERFVSAFPGGVVVVSHDRAFLERTITGVLEFEAETGGTREYRGGWREYEDARAWARESHEAAFGDYVEERRRFEALLRERRGQARAGGRQANRRGTHALASKVRAAERRLDRLEPVEKPWQPWHLRLSLAAEARSGDVVARLDGAVVERDGFRLGPVTLDLGWRDRLAIVGPNGSGKTTLLEALLGKAALSAGARYVGPGVVLGELDQERTLFTASTPLLDVFCASSALPGDEARTLLAKFNLRGDAVLRPGASLSPGERTRAFLALASARRVNCLVLDEPTNHLDLEAIEELEAAVSVYAGTIVLVTHDRRFLERFQPTRTLKLYKRSRSCASAVQRESVASASWE